MRIHHFRYLLLFALALCAQRASAFLDPPYITPANPVAGEVISVNIYGGGCDAIVGLPGYPQITQQGTEIHIVFFSVHYDDPEMCNLGSGTATTSIGSFSAGAYTLEVERRYMTVSGTWHQETLGVIPFTVSAAPSQQPIEAPTLSIAGLGVLGLALIVAMLHNLRRRVASPPHFASRLQTLGGFVRRITRYDRTHPEASSMCSHRLKSLLVLALALCAQRASALDPP